MRLFKATRGITSRTMAVLITSKANTKPKDARRGLYTIIIMAIRSEVIVRIFKVNVKERTENKSIRMWRKSIKFTVDLDRFINERDNSNSKILARNWQFPIIVKTLDGFPSQILAQTLLQIYIVQSMKIFSQFNTRQSILFNTLTRQHIELKRESTDRWLFRSLPDLVPVESLTYDPVYNIFYINDTFIGIQNLTVRSIDVLNQMPFVGIIKVEYVNDAIIGVVKIFELPYFKQSEGLYEKN